MAKYNAKIARQRRHARVRTKVIGSEIAPRLCVFRSLNHIYAQLIDDQKGSTLASASSCDPEVVGKAKDKKKMETANIVGATLGERAQSQGLKKVVFDRGGYKYHGRVKALADAARKAGLEF
jgi:large subunit ribosomal protein L18